MIDHQIITLAESNIGCNHFTLGLSVADKTITLEILSIDPGEARVLKGHLFTGTSEDSRVQFNNNKGTISVGDNLYFDGKLVGEYDSQTGDYKFHQISLSEARMISEYNDAKTRDETPFSPIPHAHSHDHSHDHKHHDTLKRIDAHTHYVAIFPMKTALEKARETQSIYIPAFAILKILKSKGILTEENQDNWHTFLNQNKIKSSDAEDFKQRDFSADLIKEDFATDIVTMTEEEKKFTHDGRDAYYINLDTLKEELGNAWGDFCNGFDLSAAHTCDFTEHMETAYNLRNWFGKDTSLMEPQLRVIYDEYEKQGIDYAETPAGFLKKPDDLKKFIEICEKIEQEREQQGKKHISIRPGLSIARLMPAKAFRNVLFSYIPLIAANPSLASITVLAHETNPSTAHIAAIREFVSIVHELRPGFTFEVHAGETATYGDVNLSDARKLALNNPNVVIRAGHAQYGSHTENMVPNFFEEKCPMSNLTLIDCEPEVQVNVLLGIAEGKSNIVWGSDGSLYNPLYSPDKQEELFRGLLGHEGILQELKHRFDAKLIQNLFGAESFDDYLIKLNENFNMQLDRNKKQEDNYISFKHHEKLFHELRLNRLKITTLFGGRERSDEQEAFLLQLARVEIDILQNKTFETFQTALNDPANINKIKELNRKCSQLIDEKTAEMDGPNKKEFLTSIENRAQHLFCVLGSQRLRERDNASFFNKVYKLGRLPNLPDYVMSSTKFPMLTTTMSILEKSIDMNIIKSTIKELYTQNKPIKADEIMSKVVEKIGLTEPEPNLRSFIEQFCNIVNSVNKAFLSIKYPERKNQSLNLIELEQARKELSGKQDYDIRLLDDPSPNTQGNFACEVFLDQVYQYHSQEETWARRNKQNLESSSLNAVTNREKINISENALVIFGKPEQNTGVVNDQRHGEYWSDLCGTIYELLKNNKEGIILLGNVNDGINPLIYEIIKTNYEKLKSVKIQHVVSNNENLLDLRNPLENLDEYQNNLVPYLIIEKEREEAQIGYSDFIQQNNLTNILMIGGGNALTFDIKNTLASRKSRDGSFFAEKIQFYENGFQTTRSSSLYAKGSPNQVYVPTTKHIKSITDEIAYRVSQDEKTNPLGERLRYVYIILESLKLWDHPNHTTLDDFQRAFTSPSNYLEDITQSYGNDDIISAQNNVKLNFENYLENENTTPENLEMLKKILQFDYAVLSYIDSHIPGLNLEHRINEKIAEPSTTTLSLQ